MGTSLQDQLLAARLQDFEARRTSAIAEAIYEQTLASLEITREEEQFLRALLAPGAIAKR